MVRDVVVVGGGHLHDPAQVLPHLGGCAGVRLVARPQLAVAVCAPGVEGALVRDRQRVSVATDHAGHHHALQGCHSLGVQLVDIVAKSKLTIAIIAPAIHLSILQYCHRAGLAARDAYDLMKTKINQTYLLVYPQNY